jgi:(4S)-4-hydroxy-5-phosphonooxypentane-2,3-dione isomerase
MTAGRSGNVTYAITVSFDLVPGSQNLFLSLVKANATASVTQESGCFRFDVLTPLGGGPDVLLYEIYKDRASFEAHLHSDHFLRFDAATRDLVSAKSVTEFAVTENAKPTMI